MKFLLVNIYSFIYFLTICLTSFGLFGGIHKNMDSILVAGIIVLYGNIIIKELG